MRKFLLLSFVSIVLLAGCGKKTSSRIVAKIGKEKVTVENITQRVRNAPLSYQEYLATDTGMKQFVDIIVRQKIMLAMAKRNNMHKRKEIVDSLKEFKNDYKNKIKQYEEELLIESYLKELESTDLGVTEKEVKKYYNNNKKDFTKPMEIRLSHILLASEQEAKKTIKQLKSGAGFPQLAKEISLDPATNSSGGDLGSFKPQELLPEFKDVVRTLAVGKITSKPVHTAYGYHILKKTHQKVLPAQSLKDSNQSIRKILLKEKFDKWIETHKKQLKVEVDYTVLELSIK